MIRPAIQLAAVLALVCNAYADQFKLSSPDLKPDGLIAEEQVYLGFGCTGKNISPSLNWSGAPRGTKSFALLVHDPDAPTGGAGWWHWLVTDIPADVVELPKGAGKADGSALPKGARQINTDFGGPGWGGPCPPLGDKPHRYNFTLHALKVGKLDLRPGATAALTGATVKANSIGQATLTGRYGRSR